MTPTPQDPRTITLSDGSVRRYKPDGSRKPWIGLNAHSMHRRMYPRLVGNIEVLTAADHRLIADVLDPPTPAPLTGEQREDSAPLTRPVEDLPTLAVLWGE